jgi:hypothetical protein
VEIHDSDLGRPCQLDVAATDAPRRGTRLDRLRHTNEQPWGAFLLGVAVNTGIVLAVGAVVFLMLTLLSK